MTENGRLTILVGALVAVLLFALFAPALNKVEDKKRSNKPTISFDLEKSKSPVREVGKPSTNGLVKVSLKLKSLDVSMDGQNKNPR